MPRLIAARHTPEQREPRDHGQVDLLAARYKYLCTFTPAVTAALPLAGNRSSAEGTNRRVIHSYSCRSRKTVLVVVR